jgi:hypothetical protein
MKDYLIGIPQVLGIGLVFTLGLVGYEFVTWKEFLSVFAVVSFGLAFLFAREVFRRNKSG